MPTQRKFFKFVTLIFKKFEPTIFVLNTGFLLLETAISQLRHNTDCVDQLLLKSFRKLAMLFGTF